MSSMMNGVPPQPVTSLAEWKAIRGTRGRRGRQKVANLHEQVHPEKKKKAAILAAKTERFRLKCISALLIDHLISDTDVVGIVIGYAVEFSVASTCPSEGHLSPSAAHLDGK